MHVATRRALLSRPAAAGGAWSPTDLASLAAWWDSSDADTLFTDAGTTPVDSDEDLIYQWNDKSGAARHMVQTTEATRPVYKTAVLNSLSSVDFRATAFMAWTGTSFDIAAAFCVFTVDAVGGYPGLLESNGAGNSRLLFTGANGIYNFYNPAGAVFDSDLRVGGVTTTTIQNVATPQIVNGTRAAATGRTALVFSYDYADALRKWDGYIAECIVLSSAPSTAEQNTIGEYLSDKWDAPWTTVT